VLHLCYYYIALRYKLKLWEVRVNLRVHKSVSRIGLVRSDYYIPSIFGSVCWDFAPDPTGELTALLQTQWSNCGRTRGTAFPFRFWWGNTVPPAYTMTATYNTSNRKKCVLNAWFKVTCIVNRVTLNHAFCIWPWLVGMFVITKCTKFGQMILRKI